MTTAAPGPTTPTLDAEKLDVYRVALQAQAQASALVPEDRRVLRDQLERASLSVVLSFAVTDLFLLVPGKASPEKAGVLPYWPAFAAAAAIALASAGGAYLRTYVESHGGIFCRYACISVNQRKSADCSTSLRPSIRNTGGVGRPFAQQEQNGSEIAFACSGHRRLRGLRLAGSFRRACR